MNLVDPRSPMPAHTEQLHLSEERFRLLVDSVRDYAIFMLDVDGTVRSWNRGAQAIKGYAAAEIVGRPFRVFYTPEDQEGGKPRRNLQQAAAEGRFEDEGWRVRKDGSQFWANVVITAVRSTDGDLLGYAKVTRDMTERHRLQELEKSTRRMNEFLAMLAHELRNPLAPMRNAVTLMQMEPAPSPLVHKSRDVLDRQLSHITRLVDDLLDVGRLTTGKIRLRKEHVRLDELVARSAEAARPVLEARRHVLTLGMPHGPVSAECDPTRIAQVIQNLLVNAAKYTPEGGRVGVSLLRRGPFAEVAVTDNGRGIPPDQVDRMFELFVQGPEHSPSDSGLGIGLTLARSLVELHGGTLEAKSDGLGLGSTFTFRLPLADAPSQPMEQGGQVRPVAPSRRVLVVDDNRDAADSTAAVLRLVGHEVECAYGGEAALAAAARWRPEVILMDIAMPGMDGFEARRRLREVPGMECVFTVAMAGYGNAEDKGRTQAAGFDAHLTKPADLDALIALLAEAGTRGAASAG